MKLGNLYKLKDKCYLLGFPMEILRQKVEKNLSIDYDDYISLSWKNCGFLFYLGKTNIDVKNTPYGKKRNKPGFLFLRNGKEIFIPLLELSIMKLEEI